MIRERLEMPRFIRGRTKARRIDVHKVLAPALGIGIFVATVLVSIGTGLWVSSGTKGAIALTPEGKPDPDGIKGWMSIETVSKNYGIPIEYLYTTIGLPPDISPDTPAKDIEKIVPGFGVETLREIVRAATMASGEAALGQTDGTGAADLTAAMSATPAKSTEEQQSTSSNNSNSVANPSGTQPPAGASVAQTPAVIGPPVSGAVHDSGEPEGGIAAGTSTYEGRGAVETLDPSNPDSIKGSMTLEQVIEAFKVPKEYVLKELGIPMDYDIDQQLRLIRQDFDFETSELRDLIKKYLETHAE